MKIKFDEQQYQTKAMNAISDIFEGQPVKVSNFTVSTGEIVGQETTVMGIGNKLVLSDAELLENIQKIQVKNHLPKSNHIQDRNFTVEMETGTGKTYIYTRTIFELNKLYGFSKFIIVVPSVAIREGAYKSLEMTQEHFKGLYPGQHCHFWKYDSSKLEQVRDFATSTNIEVMIINIDAFKKSFDDPTKENKANLIHRERDTMNGRKPIQFIQETKPIVIIDEPQSVDNTEKSKEAIASLNPLCKLRYSATHKETYNLMYRLNPIQAYEQGLVKKIEVLSIQSESDHNDPYIRFMSASHKNGTHIKAKVEMDIQKKDGMIKRDVKEVNSSTKANLYLLSRERDLYQGYVISSINAAEGNETIEFENGVVLRPGQVVGGLDDDVMKRYQIREAIRAHLDKELKLVPKGIKVLTLFFVDKVSNYRIYPESGSWEKGKYAEMFEEEYQKLLATGAYDSLFEEGAYIANPDVKKVHNGYFSQDSKGKFKDSKVKNDGTLSSNKDDESTFELIMKEKEKLLGFNEPLRFIFSHSALKEGWDNPNVFQICTLVETQDTITKRQKIGRGLRLAVNQDGVRQYDENINILTVIANESYQDFAETLQREMEDETGVKFGYIEEHVFATITALDEMTNEPKELGYDVSKEIFIYLVQEKYINTKGKIEKKLKEAIASNTFKLKEAFKPIEKDVATIIKLAIKKLPIFNANDKVTFKLNKEVILGEDFKKLWDKIKYKTTYSVDFDVNLLIRTSVQSIQRLPKLKSRKITKDIAKINIEQKGITAEEMIYDAYYANEEQHRLPDVLRYLQEHTNLKRRTLVEILIQSNRLDEFRLNPQVFMEQIAAAINKEKRNLILDGVKYTKVGDYDFYEQSLFEQEELTGYFKKNAMEVQNEKSIYDYIRYDSTIEQSFAEGLNNDPNVKLFVKLPRFFVIDTPLGNYNPDWAILFNKNGHETLYFVVETKGSVDDDDLRLRESGKISCGRKHFAAINPTLTYDVVDTYRKFKEDLVNS